MPSPPLRPHSPNKYITTFHNTLKQAYKKKTKKNVKYKLKVLVTGVSSNKRVMISMHINISLKI
jgi:hypothetical protein